MRLRTYPNGRRRSLLASLVAVSVGLGASLAAAPASAATSCSPGINPLAPGSVVAPGLRVISEQFGLGTCPNGFFVSARGPDGTVWVTDYSNGLWKSTDDLRTLVQTYTATGYSQIEQVLQLSSGTVLISVRDANGVRHILRSTDSSATSFASTPVLDLPSGSALHDSNSWLQLGSAIYIGQYGGGPPVDLWKSTDDGRTFSVAWQGTDVDEIHAVQADPYHPGRLWMMLDGNESAHNGSATRVGYSDDGGQTFTWITQGGPLEKSRVVDLMFTSDAVYWGCDCPDVPGGLYKWNRATGQVSQLMSGLNGPFYDAVSYNGQVAQFSVVEPASIGYTGDQFIHILTNGDGTSWSLTRTPWSRDQGDTTRVANPQGNTQPDSQGRFWVSYFDLAGSQYLAANIEFQFDPTAQYNGVSSSFTASPSPFAVSQPVGFDGSGSSSPAGSLSYQWTFGDGSTTSGAATTSHTYASGGPFSASLQVSDANNDAALSTETLSSTAQLPTVTTGSAPATSTTATLYGAANPNGSATTAHFEYGTTTSYGSTTSDQSLGSGASVKPLTAALSGLQPNTTYHYRVDASNSAGASQGSDGSFTTPPSPTSATTNSATNLQGVSATLNGTVNPGGLDTTVYFDYGTTTSYGSSTPAQGVGDGSSPTTPSAPASGLQGNTTYHFRVVAVNESGTFDGADQTFATLGPPPTATTGGVTFVTSSGGTLGAIVNPNGNATTAHFEYGPTTAYGAKTTDQQLGSGSTAQPMTAAISGLQPNTTYHFRVDATNSNATVSGTDGIFTTAAGPPVTATTAATSVTTNAATANGTVDPQGLTTTARFEYGTDTGYGTQTPVQTLPGNLVPNPSFETDASGWSIGGTNATTFASQPGWASAGAASARFTTGTIGSGGYSEADVDPYIQGITPGTQYNAAADLNILSLASGQRVVLYLTWRDSNGNGLGKLQMTATAATGVTTLSGSAVAPANAAQAQVDITVENAGVADLYFDNVRLLAAGTGSAQALSAQLANLAPGTTYHYRLVATSSAGTSIGSDKTFTTQAPPTATTSAATGVSSNAATLNGSVNPNGAGTSVHFEYGLDTTYGKSTAVQDAGAGSTAVPMTAPISGLAANTVYHYRVVAVSAIGTTNGADQLFTTAADTGPPSSSATAPAMSNTSSWTVAYTASDSSGGPGLAKVDLYAEAPGQSTYAKVASDTSGNGSGSFSYAAAAGDGTYNFYTIATDKAGTAEAAPASPEASTVLDTTAPTSAASSPTYSSTAAWTVSYTASDNTGGSGLASVELWVKPPGASSYSKAATNTSGNGSGSFGYTAAAGDGSYSFYTIAVDAAGNREAAPSSADTTTILDTTTPTSAASSPTYSATAAWTVSYTASDITGGPGLASVELWVKPPGASSYSKTATNTSSSGSGSFSYTAAAGDGSYSFYTIAVDAAGNREAAPGSAEATTFLDTVAPTSAASSPTYAITATWAVSYTASDNTGGSGLASVELWVKPPGASSYSKAATNTSGNGSGSFSYTAAAGDGSYSFYTIAVDKAGNRQPAPSNANATTILDTTAPSAFQMTDPGQYLSGTLQLALSSAPTDGGSGMVSVAYQYRPSGTTSWLAACTSSSSPWTCNWNTTANADGPYDFRAVASDKAGNTTVASNTPLSNRTIENTAPKAKSISTTNVSGGTKGRVDNGDTVTFTYTETMSASSILAGWTGASTAVQVRIGNNGSNDQLTVWKSNGSAQLPIAHPLALGGRYVSSSSTFNATMVQNGAAITVTIGSRTNGSLAFSPVTGGTLTWTPNANATNQAGVKASTTAVSSAGPAF